MGRSAQPKPRHGASLLISNTVDTPLERAVFDVPEYGYVDVPLDFLLADGAVDVDSEGAGRYFTIQFQKQTLRLQARGFIGFIPINDRVAVEVTPRCPIANLARVLRLGNFAPMILERVGRTYAVEPAEAPKLRDFYAESLLGEVEQIEAHGRMRQYEQRRGRTSSPRGRIVMGAPTTQLAASGASASVASSWFERTADTPANRCVKMAIWLLAHGYALTRQPTRRQRQLARRLNAAYALFEDAALDYRYDFLRDGLVVGTHSLPTTRLYYRNALDIARMIVTSSTVALDRQGTDVRMDSVVVAMETVFEAYVRNVLAEGVTELSVEDGNKEGSKPLFDEAPSQRATPDIVVSAAEGNVHVVLDVKYKPATGAPDRDDLNQTVTYGFSYRAPAVVIVQPRAKNGSRRGLIKLGRIAELSVYQYVMDLAAEDLAAEEEALVRAVSDLARQGEDGHEASSASLVMPAT